ncbi:hypothetical protein [Methylomicrobium agile]|uniref:hypothetical protein n=1 Tax=Methylomicrobium agile TaxID=39774 RepID=UPI0004DFB171|nr:hypothetical protein [Methylomicrobium agile]
MLHAKTGIEPFTDDFYREYYLASGRLLTNRGRLAANEEYRASRDLPAEAKASKTPNSPSCPIKTSGGIVSAPWQNFANRDYGGGYVAVYNKEWLAAYGNDGEQ